MADKRREQLTAIGRGAAMSIKTLVVDNNPVLLKALTTIIAQEGCEVRAAATGLEALEILDNYDPDIVFTDLIMPLVSGEQLCRIIRKTRRHQNVFIVVLSAIILEDRERILKEIQCDICIAKGNLSEIRHHIREALVTFKERKNVLDEVGKKQAKIPEGLQPSDVTSELLKEKKHLAAILSNLEEGILELSAQGKIVTMNAAAIELLAKREEDLVGKYLPDAIDWGVFKKPLVQWTEGQLIDRGMERFEILEHLPLTIGEKVLTIAFVPVFEDGKIFGLIILRDITRQDTAEKHNKELDNAFRFAKKMDALSCMAGGVAHDFNNLLTVICGNLDIITLHWEKKSNQERYRLIEQAQKAALVAADLTRRISCFSNFGIVSREKTQIVALIESTVERFFKEEEGGAYTVEFSCEDSWVYVDPEEIHQALTNVLLNAQEASGNEKIAIRVEVDTFLLPQLLRGQYVPAGAYARIDIADSGIGIGADNLFKIFDPYYSTKERGSLKGMGLGLTVVYAILRNHGGHVVVSSEPHKGTVVSIYLPILHESMEETSANRQIIGENLDKSVLLIDSDNQMCKIGKIMLNYLGFSVHIASNRTEALAILRQMLTASKVSRPLVILDLYDTNGESAVETCRQMCALEPALQVVAMSGTILDPVMEDCRQFGFVSTLPKPYTMDSLKHVITHTLMQA